MPSGEPRLAAALGSRICHDLASPLGGLMAGIDLLEAAGNGSVETALMRESVAGANATLQVTRLAFGQAGRGEDISAGNLRNILGTYLESRPRLTLDWALDGAMPRAEAQGLMLATLCALHALPRGGTLGFARADAAALRLTARGTLAVDRALWDGLSRRAPLPAPDPRRIEFHLLARHLATRPAGIIITEEPDRLTLVLSRAKAD